MERVTEQYPHSPDGTGEVSKHKRGNYRDDKTHLTYPYWRNAAIYGVIGGLLVAIMLFGIQAAGAPNAIGMKYAAYFLLGAAIFVAIGDYDRFLPEGQTFKNGISYGARIAIIAGTVLVLINLIMYLTGSDYAFSKYGMESDDFANFSLVSFSLMLECFVAGMAFNFIALQYFKGRKNYDDKRSVVG